MTVNGTAPIVLRKLRLLVVDDNRVNQMLLSSILGRLGHQVEVAASAAEALSLLGQSSFDMVLMDYLMPDQDGFEATRLIRALPPPVGQIPVIGVSADVDGTPDHRPAACGMNASVAKPIARETLLRVIDSCLPQPAHQFE